MKTKISLGSAFILIVCFVPLENIGQEISTNAEIYDFEIGDVFHYTGHDCGVITKEIRTITDKYYSVNNDTLFYPYEFEKALRYGWSDTTWTYGSGNGMLSYTDLDSLVNDGIISYVGSEPWMYNGRFWNEYSPCECILQLYVVGCGMAEDVNFEEPNFCWNISLVYFKKGEEEWGNPILFYTGINRVSEISHIHVYPNPVSDYLHIGLDKSNSGFEQAIIHNQLGQKVLTAKPVNNMVDVSGLKAGMYLIEVSTRDRKERTKFVKN